MNDSSKNDEKLLLCRPIGGLNDTLCQIEKCWRYAEQFGRTLIIDTTRKSGLLGEFSEYFALKDNLPHVILNLKQHQLSYLNSLSCFPSAVQGRLDTYETIRLKQLKNWCDKDTLTQLTFDFDRNHSEAILIHEQSGGGTLSTNMLNRVTIAPRILPKFAESLNHLGYGYVAIHVRNTDRQTQYEEFFNTIYSRVSGKVVLICSDDADVISRAKIFFNASKVVTSSITPRTGRKPLHMRNTYSDDEQRKYAAINSIIDLIALGKATELYFSKDVKGRISGFSTLAMYLTQNKKVIDMLIPLERLTPTPSLPSSTFLASHRNKTLFY